MKNYLMLASLAAVAIPSAAMAETGSDWTLEGGVSAASDYRFRGISLSDQDPQVSGELSVSHKSGFYASVWASNVALTGSASDVEADWIVGWNGKLGKANLQVNGTYYSYPGNSGFNYYEVNTALGTNLGKSEIKIGLAYAPKQDNLGGRDNTYVYVSGNAPIGDTPLSISGTFGIEDGAFADAKKDWQLGLSYDLGGGFEASASYVDTAHANTPLGKATALASLKWGF